MGSVNKKRNHIYWICLVFINCFIVSNSYSQSVTLDSVIKSQVGVRELTGNNDGKDVEKYLKITGLSKGYPWCAAFCAWAFKESGIKAPTSAYTPDWFKSNVVYTREFGVEPIKSDTGQVFGLYFESKGRIAHIGFIVGEDRNNYYTIEGNTNKAGSREGDGVYKKIRSKKSIYKIRNYETKIIF